MQIVWSKQTQADFRRFSNFLDTHNASAAIRAAKDIRQQTQTLIDNPEIGTSIEDNTNDRELYINSEKHGYVIRYKIIDHLGTIRILQIWHGREDR